MSADRELLEFAAKADGIVGKWVTNFDGDYYYQGNSDGIYYSYPEGGSTVWNPLTDDGDALRLSANLHIDVEQNLCHITARYWISDEGGLVSKCVSVDVQGDRISATRIAIVRAAAEIGRAMP